MQVSLAAWPMRSAGRKTVSFCITSKWVTPVAVLPPREDPMRSTSAFER